MFLDCKDGKGRKEGKYKRHRGYCIVMLNERGNLGLSCSKTMDSVLYLSSHWPIDRVRASSFSKVALIKIPFYETFINFFINFIIIETFIKTIIAHVT